MYKRFGIQSPGPSTPKTDSVLNKELSLGDIIGWNSKIIIIIIIIIIKKKKREIHIFKLC